jgi:hypothetical protein
MKKVFFSALLALTMNFGFAAAHAELFNVDEQEINAEFAQLNELEQFVSANEGITLSEINPSNPLVQNVNNSSDILGTLSSLKGEPPLGIPSIVWGICCSVPGVAIVYFVSEDEEETKKAVIGCAISGAVYVLYYVLGVVVGGLSFAFF